MPSEIANTIVNHIFSDEKSKAIDVTNDALSAAAYDAIEVKKKEFAKEWGFNPDQTGQKDADEIADKVFDGQEPPEVAPTAGEIANAEQEEVQVLEGALGVLRQAAEVGEDLDLQALLAVVPHRRHQVQQALLREVARPVLEEVPLEDEVAERQPLLSTKSRGGQGVSRRGAVNARGVAGASPSRPCRSAGPT